MIMSEKVDDMPRYATVTFPLSLASWRFLWIATSSRKRSNTFIFCLTIPTQLIWRNGCLIRKLIRCLRLSGQKGRGRLLVSHLLPDWGSIGVTIWKGRLLMSRPFPLGRFKFNFGLLVDYTFTYLLQSLVVYRRNIHWKSCILNRNLGPHLGLSLASSSPPKSNDFRTKAKPTAWRLQHFGWRPTRRPGPEQAPSVSPGPMPGYTS